MAYTTADLQRYFEDAFDSASISGSSLYEYIRQQESAAGALLTGGTISSTSTNGRTSTLVFDGRIPGAVTTKDVANAWRELITIFQRTSRFLRYCVANGLDPQQTELTGAPATLPTPLASLADQDIAEWLMGSDWLLDKAIPTTRTWDSHLFPVTESQPDYTWTRIPPGVNVI